MSRTSAAASACCSRTRPLEVSPRPSCLPVALRVRRTNARAIACYRRIGFTVTGSGTKTLPSGEAVPYYSMVALPC